ncbi:MAG: alpha/beta hydrolase [Lachnospiraceae bacterium]|nr:alpha/beta hydrolase [Lachnospiraceae bacterium]
MNLLKVAAGAAVAGAAGEYALAVYFFNRTMIRSNAKRERTQKMAGTDWDKYIPHIREAKEKLMENSHEDMYITSEDGLKLHATWFPCEGSKKVVICFHGYTSEGLNDYSTLALFYRNNGYNLLIVDERAHGQSEGKYIGFGCLDRHDAMLWIRKMIEKLGEDCKILLHGDSMGAATVLMTNGLKLPPQVKAAVSDCAFTSAWDVFTSVLNNMYHLPAFPLMQIANRMIKQKAGYELDECDARKEVAKAEIPILFIHGSADSFVPCSMVYELYEACRTEKKLLVIEGAGHVESCYRDEKLYQEAIESFIFPIVER